MLLLATLVGTAAAAFSGSDRPRRGAVGGPHERLDIRFRRFAWFTAASVFVLILVGAVVRAEGAGLAFPDWPLFGGAVVPKLSGLRPALHFAHRVLALEAGVLVSVLAVLGWRLRRVAPPVALLSVSAAGLFLGQVLGGAAAVWSGLAPAAIVAHVGLSSLVWGAVVATAASAQFAESWSRAAGSAPLRRLDLAQGPAR
jgi:cytochrome c oxidase assembly protein subunit 15